MRSDETYELTDDRSLLGALPLGDEKFIVIGRAAGHVNVELGDPSIGLVHAAIINSSSKTFILQLDQASHTFIDGVKAAHVSEPVTE